MTLQLFVWLVVIIVAIWLMLKVILPFILALLLVYWGMRLWRKRSPLLLAIIAILAFLAGRSLGRSRR
jgi:hypothetical protein